MLSLHLESAFLLALTPQDKLELQTDKSERRHSMRPPSVNIPGDVDLLVAQKHTTPVLHPAVEPALLLVYPQGTFVEAEVLA